MTALALKSLNSELLQQFIGLAYSLTGITLNESKALMVEGRLRKRIKVLNLQSYQDYYELLNQNAEEKKVFINLITTNETYFFRTDRIWSYVESEFLPCWKNDFSNRKLRIWSAASSSGEEAYSIAICCENQRVDYQILGTDISSDVLERARSGLYAGRSVEGFKLKRAELFGEYLQVRGELFEVVAKLRAKVNFEEYNLIHPRKLSDQFNLVFLRNVLIYFKKKDQERVIRNIAAHVNIGGVMVIGESESLYGLDVPFEYVSPLIYRRTE